MSLPVNEAELNAALKTHKQVCFAEFKQNLMGGAELLNSPKGMEYQLKVKEEMRKITYTIKERNRQALRKTINEKIQHAIDTEVKPKIDDEETKYNLNDLKKDIEAIRDRYVDEYPLDMILQKVHEVGWQMTNLLLVSMRQSSSNAERMANLKV